MDSRNRPTPNKHIEGNEANGRGRPGKNPLPDVVSGTVADPHADDHRHGEIRFRSPEADAKADQGSIAGLDWFIAVERMEAWALANVLTHRIVSAVVPCPCPSTLLGVIGGYPLEQGDKFEIKTNTGETFAL